MSRDTSFYYSFLVLPPRKRAAIVAVWDFCRAVDDAVDEAEGPDEGAQRLAVWRHEVDAVFTGTPGTPQGRALQPFLSEFPVPRTPFDELLDGVTMDLTQARYPTFDALAAYCRRVASGIGLICVEIFGYTDMRARSYAVNLGMALQLTNIVRDITADLARGRVYLPEDELCRFGVTAEDLRAGVVTPPVRALMEFQCRRAREYYQRAAAELPAADAYSLRAAEIMGAIYFDLLQRIERAGYDVFSSRIRVPRAQRAAIALRVLARAMAGMLGHWVLTFSS